MGAIPPHAEMPKSIAEADIAAFGGDPTGASAGGTS
jgi:hypothetical protein